MTPEQREKIHDELRTLLRSQQTATLLLEDAAIQMIWFVDGQPLDADAIRKSLEEYDRAIPVVRGKAIAILHALLDLALAEDAT